MWMLLVDVSIWFKDLHALCPPLYFLFFPTCLYHAPSFSHFFITIFFRLQFDQSTHHCICEHIYFLLRMLCLFHSVEDQIHLPKSQRWGGDLLHHCLSRPLTCKVILQSFSTLGLYPPTEKPIYNQRWVVFFFFFFPLMHLIILNHLWNNPMHYAEEREFMQLCYMMRRSHGVPLLM